MSPKKHIYTPCEKCWWCGEVNSTSSHAAESAVAAVVSSPMPAAEILVRGLTEHWLTEVNCQQAGATDQALCYCGWRGAEYKSVGEAVLSWASHVAAELRRLYPPASLESSGTK